MDGLIVTLVVCLVTVCIGMLGFLAWRENEHRKQIDELTSKIMARSLNDYAIAKQTMSNPLQPKVEKQEKKISDPVLGLQY